MKQQSHINAESYLDKLINLSLQGEDKLEQGLKISAAGNIIDVVFTEKYDLWDEVISTVNHELQGGGFDAFRRELLTAPHLLYLADNVGETTFDRVFIETLDLPVYYAVKSGPILNDATREDALAAGIDKVAIIVETGSRALGTNLSECAEDFRQLFENSSLIISKGQANFEMLDEMGEKIFFLMRAKCPVISQVLNVQQNHLVLKQGDPKI